MLGPVRHDLWVLTMESVLSKAEKFDIFVIDEADDYLIEFGHVVDR